MAALEETTEIIKVHEPKLCAGDVIDRLTLCDWDLDYERGRAVIRWNCKCECGNEITITERSLLKDDHVHSCGCYAKEKLTPGDIDRVKKAGKMRAAKRNKDGCNVDMLFRKDVIKTNTSGVQGISWHKAAHKWNVYIGYKNRRANLGYYEDIRDAKKIRELGLQAIKDNTFEDFYKRIRGKDFTEISIQKKKGTSS